MKLLQYVAAYVAAGELWQRECAFETAHALMMLRRRLLPHVQFYLEQWEAIRARYTEQDEERLAKLAELYAVVVEDAAAKVCIRQPGRMTPEQIEALEPFCAFGEGAGA